VEDCVVVPNPTITPESPENEDTLFISTTGLGDEIRTWGGLDEVYPAPGFVIATPVIVPPAPIVTVPSALVEVSTPTVDPKLTIAVVYPTPPSEITTEEIVPKPETMAVPMALDLSSCDMIVILFWKVKVVSFSFWALKNGLTLSTYIAVDPIPTVFIT